MGLLICGQEAAIDHKMNNSNRNLPFLTDFRIFSAK